MEDGRRLQLVFEMECSIFSLQTNMHVAEIQLLIQESTESLRYLTGTLELFCFTVLYLQGQYIIIDFRTVRIKHDFNFETRASRHFVRKWLRNEYLGVMYPSKFSWGIAVVCQHQTLGC